MDQRSVRHERGAAQIGKLDDEGARSLAAAILAKAAEDIKARQKMCKSGAAEAQLRIEHRRLKTFIDSEWCQILCDIVGVKHKDYVNAARRLMEGGSR